MRKHVGSGNPSTALGFPALPLANMTCQYSSDTMQYDWRNAQLANYNMFPQSSHHQGKYIHFRNSECLFLTRFMKDGMRNDYTSFLDANYALSQAQMAQTSNASSEGPYNKTKASCEKKDGNLSNDSSVASQTWSRNAEWNQLSMNFHQQGELSANNFFGQSQYGATKNYWA